MSVSKPLVLDTRLNELTERAVQSPYPFTLHPFPSAAQKGTGMKERGGRPALHKLSTSQMPCRQHWQKRQESTSLLYYPDNSLSSSTLVHTLRPLWLFSLSPRKDCNSHTFFISTITLTMNAKERMPPGHTTPPCDRLALGRCKDIQKKRRTHPPAYNIIGNKNRANIIVTNTGSRWRRTKG